MNKCTALVKLILTNSLAVIMFAPCVCWSEIPLVKIQKGQYELFYRDQKQEPGTKIEIPALLVQKYPVSNKEYLVFVKKSPEWGKKKAAKIFSAPNYLDAWSGDASFPAEIENYPVLNITWFAASAYCDSLGLRLLSVNEWEYAADQTDKKALKMVLEWYAEPKSIRNVNEGKENRNKLVNMHGLIWEWVSDFSSIIIKADSRGTNDRERGLFCGAGSLGSASPELYANYMRFAFRSSLKANYATSNLGFRCGKSAE